MKSASAFSPCYVTGFFFSSEDETDPLSMGSLGAGFCLKKGVKTTVALSPDQDNDSISINGRKDSEAKVSKKVAELFFEKSKEPRVSSLIIEHQIQVPQGSGFGTSGAGALSLSAALNKLFGFPLTDSETYQVAHLAEIVCKTGLGTVLSEVNGGFLIRTKPGAPGIGAVKKLPFPSDYVAAFIAFGAVSTAQLLSDSHTLAKIKTLGKDSLYRLEQNPTPEEFVALSYHFAKNADLLTVNCKDTLGLLEKYNINGSMNMFGDVVFTLIKKKDERALEQIRNFPNGRVMFFELSKKGVMVS